MKADRKSRHQEHRGSASTVTGPSARERQSQGGRGRIHAASIMTTVAAGIALCACSSLQTPIEPDRVTGTGSDVSQNRLRGEFPPVLSGAVTFAAAYQMAIADPADGPKAKLFAQAGIALSDELCASWFEALERAKVKDGFKKDFVTNAGAMAAVLLELARAGSAPITGVAAGATFLGNTIDSHLANYVVAPDLGVVKDAVDKSRAVRAAEIEKAQLDFYRAYSAVIRYDYSCSHSEVKRIVNASIRKVGEDTLRKHSEGPMRPEEIPLERSPSFQPGFAAPSAAVMSRRRFSAPPPPPPPRPSRSFGPSVKELVPGLSPAIE